MTTTHLTTVLVSTLGVLCLCACDTQGGDPVGRKAGALSGIGAQGDQSQAYTGLGQTGTVQPNGIGASPWEISVDPRDCTPACATALQCFPELTYGFSACVDDCIAMLGPDTEEAVKCLATATSCAVAVNQCETGLQPSGLGPTPSSDEGGLGDEPAATPTPAADLDCDTICSKWLTCEPGQAALNQCMSACVAAPNDPADLNYFTCLQSAATCDQVEGCLFAP